MCVACQVVGRPLQDCVVVVPIEHQAIFVVIQVAEARRTEGR